MAVYFRSLLTSALYGRVGHYLSSRKIWDTRRCNLHLWMIRHVYGQNLNYPHSYILSAQARNIKSLCASLGHFSKRVFSAETGVPFSEDEYPPLPEYNSKEESKDKEIFIICAKGLPWSCTAEDLLVFFSECKIRDGVNGIHLMHNRNGLPSGKAFIELEHQEDVQKALRKHRHYLGPRYVEVKEVTDSDVQSLLTSSAQLPAKDAVVRLRGLPYSCTEEDVVQFFSGLDIIEGGVTFVPDDQGRNSGIAYVEFSSQEVADQALEKNREKMGRRYIEVFPSRKSAIQSECNGRQEHSPPSTSSGMFFHDDWSGESVQEASDSDVEGLPTSPVSLPAEDGVVRLRGLPYSCTQEDVLQFFSGLDIAEDGVTFVFDKKGRNTGYAYVQFASQEMADQALQKNREVIGTRYIEVFPSRKSAIPSQHVVKRTDSPCFTVNGNSETDVQSLPERSSVTPKVSSITTHCIHMRGLPFEATGQDIVKFFSPLPLSKIYMECGPDGRASGEADVYFTCHEDAVSAMTRDKATIDERYIELFLNSAKERS